MQQKGKTIREVLDVVISEIRDNEDWIGSDYLAGLADALGWVIGGIPPVPLSTLVQAAVLTAEADTQ